MPRCDWPATTRCRWRRPPPPGRRLPQPRRPRPSRHPSRPRPASAPAAAEAAFGLRRSSESLQEIRSHIPGRFDGWSRNTRIRLANGQLWLVIDDGRASYANVQDVKVTIHRAMLGSS